MSDDGHVTKAELQSRMQQGWDEFTAYLATLSPAQLTGPTDAAGWTAKDHVAHIARWEEGILAALNGQNRREAMGVSEADWESHDYDIINAGIRERDTDKSLDEVMALLRDVHGRLAARIDALTDADLERRYDSYVPGTENDRPIVGYIIGNTYEHYDEHRPWIDAIVNPA